MKRFYSSLKASNLEPLAALLKLNVSQLYPINSSNTPLDLSPIQLYSLLSHSLSNTELRTSLYSYANAVTEHYFDNQVYFRGIVEFSNVCQKDCGYCGIRKHQPDVSRYTMTADEILSCAEFCWKQGYGSIMLQSGELNTTKRIDWLASVVKEIVQHTSSLSQKIDGNNLPGLRVALSVGELDYDSYKKLYEAGASRYLLRIETSSRDLYEQLHPQPGHSYDRRMQCLHSLLDIGYQVGSGFLLAIPGQNLRHIVRDLMFLKHEIPVDMIGIGPYVYEPHTPVGLIWEKMYNTQEKQNEYKSVASELTMIVYALSRIIYGDVNISATTALQALSPNARELSLQRGANVVMPIITPSPYRGEYKLYQDKPCVDGPNKTAFELQKCGSCLQHRISWAGKSLKLFEWGDPPRFTRRKNKIDL